MGRPRNTARAPRASALNTSLPCRIPPSTYTSTDVPRTASIISGNASIYEKKYGLIIPYNRVTMATNLHWQGYDPIDDHHGWIR